MCVLGDFVRATTLKEPIFGYRVFVVRNVTANGGYGHGRVTKPRLTSGFEHPTIVRGKLIDAHYVYALGKTHTARYMHAEVRGPEYGNSMGFWAFKKMKDARRYGLLHCGRGSYLLAKVQLSGAAVVHEDGYRAMKMKIVSFISPAKAQMEKLNGTARS